MKFSIRKTAIAAILMMAPQAAMATGAAKDTAATLSAACLKSVQAMGGTMGQAEEKTSDGQLAYHFVVRTNGIDYDVVCDGATGLVKDVARRMGPDSEAH